MDNICALDGCNNPIYTGNAIVLTSSIGMVTVYLCSNHLSEAIQASIDKQSKEFIEDIKKNREQHGQQ